MSSMRILPVLDLMGGVVVRGIGGRRHEYRPLVSGLTPSCKPVEVAEAFRAHFGLTALYLADLDAIAGAPPALTLLAELRARGFRLWVDAGVRTLDQAEALAAASIERIVVGLETIAGPAALAAACTALGRERIVFSLDLKDGRPLGRTDAWDAPDAWTIAVQAVGLGVRRLLVLDLARVGGNTGAGTEELCRRLKTAYPDVALAAGGGVRDAADLERLRRCEVEEVLIASALHDGRLRREDLAPFTS
jgi:phosphoribosylformimino-5-aminoimidazole carboxamide ribotide isomerase